MSRTGPRLRREALRDMLPTSVDALGRACVAALPAGYDDDYLALRWLEWHAGRLRITPAGSAVCRTLEGRRA
jgi:hypothetical protein